MGRFEELTGVIREAAEQPFATAKRCCDRTGKKAIGCFKGYVPEELVHALGMLPVGLWGAATDISAANRYFPAFYCAPVRQTLELGIRGELDFLSGVIIPAHCDTLKAAGQNWKAAVGHIPFLPLVYPHNRKQEFGRRYLRSELDELIDGLERIAGRKLDDGALWAGIRVYNNYRCVLREFLACAAQHRGTALLRHQACAAGFVLEKAEYALLLTELTRLLRSMPEETGKRVVLVGTMLDNPEIMTVLEQNGLAVAGDDLLEHSRLARHDVPGQEGDPIEMLVRRWSEADSCALLYDPAKQRGERLLGLVRETGADGVLFCMSAFCDPEDYDYPYLRGLLKENGIASLRIDQGGDGALEQARTRIQGFAEILGVSGTERVR